MATVMEKQSNTLRGFEKYLDILTIAEPTSFLYSVRYFLSHNDEKLQHWYKHCHVLPVAPAVHQ